MSGRGEPAAPVREGLERATLLVPVVVVVAVAAAVWASVGAGAAASSLAGGIGAVVLLAATPAVLGPMVSAAPPSALLSALAFYLLKVTVLSAALVALSSETGRRVVEPQALGFGVALGVLAYTSALVIATVRARRPTYELGSALSSEDD